jgi:tetratricopeptide (TPR) repeat protein
MGNTSRNLAPILFGIAFLLLSTLQTHAFFPPRVDPSHNPELSGQLTEVIGSHWFVRKEKLLTGEDHLGKEELEAIYQGQLDRGIRSIPLLSFLLLRESRRALDRNDLERAEYLCEYAKKYSPDFPSAYFTMGRIYWSRSKTLVNLVFREYVRGVYATLTNFRIMLFRSLNALYLISGALLLTFLAFVVIMGLKHLSLYIHDVKKEFDLTPAKFLAGVFKVFVFLVPVILDFNLPWTLLYWTMLIWGYLSRREKQMTVMFLFILVYIPWILGETTLFLGKPDFTMLMTAHRVNNATWNGASAESLREWGQKNPEDADILFTLGLLSKRQANYGAATRYYKEALQYDPAWAGCISNLGNVYLGTGHLEEAIKHYEQAIALSPRGWSPYFNLHRAFSKESILASEKGGQALEIANELNPRLVVFYTEIYSANMNRAVVDDTLTASRLWNRVLRFYQTRYDPPELILTPWLKGVSGKYSFIYPAFFLALLIFLALLYSRKNFAKRCPMCGTPSLKFFPRKIHGDAVCFGCNRLFVKRESIDPKMKEKRMKQVKRFGQRKTALRGFFSVILPGGGHLWKGQPMKGSLFVFFFFILGLKYFWWNGIVPDPVVLGGTPGFWVRSAFVLFVLIYYVGVLRSSLRIQS